MKNLLLILLIAVGLTCCNSDNDNSGSSIIGTWSLTSAGGTITGHIDQFEQGQILWTFNSNHTVDVVNLVTGTQMFSGLPTGTYNYNILVSPGSEHCATTISIDGASFLCLTVTENEISMGHDYPDGFGYYFQPAAIIP